MPNFHPSAMSFTLFRVFSCHFSGLTFFGAGVICYTYSHAQFCSKTRWRHKASELLHRCAHAMKAFANVIHKTYRHLLVFLILLTSVHLCVVNTDLCICSSLCDERRSVHFCICVCWTRICASLHLCICVWWTCICASLCDGRAFVHLCVMDVHLCVMDVHLCTCVWWTWV